MGNQLIREQIIKILKSHSYHHTEGVGVKSQFKYLAEIAFECCADEIMLALDQSQFTADEAEEHINQEVKKRIEERIGSVESINYLLLDTALKCPHCGGVGYTVAPNYHTGEPEQEQCRWCWELEHFRSHLTNPGDSQKTEGGNDGKA